MTIREIEKLVVKAGIRPEETSEMSDVELLRIPGIDKARLKVLRRAYPPPGEEPEYQVLFF